MCNFWCYTLGNLSLDGAQRWQNVWKTSQKCGFAPADQVYWLAASFCLNAPFVSAISATDLFATSPSLIQFGEHRWLRCWFIVDGLHHTDVGSCNITSTPTHIHLETDSVVDTAQSPLLILLHRLSLIHLTARVGVCLLHAERNRANAPTSINIQGYCVPFQQYVSPNPRVIHPWWI